MRRKLLLADDSVTIQRVVELTFSGEDIAVVAVSDGEQAIARIPAEQPDIVLADIAMPKKNGYEVAAFVKEHPTLSKVPVLLLAGAFEPVDEERARKVKCDGVLVKPFETHEVIARVRELLDGDRAGRRRVEPAPAPKPAVPEKPVPEKPAAVAAARGESIDDYFDRLDAAFASSRPNQAGAPAPSVGSTADTPVPTLETLIGNISPSQPQHTPRPFPHLSPPPLERPDTSAQLTPAPAPAQAPAGDDRNVIADLFQAFLDVEQGERDPASVRIPEALERIKRRNTIE